MGAGAWSKLTDGATMEREFAPALWRVEAVERTLRSAAPSNSRTFPLLRVAALAWFCRWCSLQSGEGIKPGAKPAMGLLTRLPRSTFVRRRA
jgi:hypothetical protein